MPINEPLDWGAFPAASADLNDHLRDAVRWLAGFSAGPKGIVSLSSSIAVPLTTTPGWTTLAFDTADINVAEAGDELWDASAPELIVFPQACIALFGGGIRVDATTANKALRVILNSDDASPLVEHDNIGVDRIAFTSINVTRLYTFAPGDSIELQGYQDSGGTVNAIVEGKSSPQFWAIWMAVNNGIF